MHTPAHIAASLLVWRDECSWRRTAAVVFGAMLPDLPMFAFYAYQKTMGNSERLIWSTLYYQDHWQVFFDIFNSIPIALLVIGLCWWRRFSGGVLIASSATLHMLCDLPLHHEDAHRHFFPFPWRFLSPISYWDPAHYGHLFAVFELCCAVAASGYVALRGPHVPMRVMGRVNLVLYLCGLLFAASMWIGPL